MGSKLGIVWFLLFLGIIGLLGLGLSGTLSSTSSSGTGTYATGTPLSQLYPPTNLTASTAKVDAVPFSEDISVVTTASGGRKKALLFGLNYTGTPNELQGCIQDVQVVRQLLSRSGFGVTIMTDETEQKPTLANMERAINTFLASLQAGDTAFLWFSGHGTLLTSGMNAWVPIDFATAGCLSEGWFTMKLRWIPSNVRLFIGSDSCHSGSMLNLKYDIEPLPLTLKTRRGMFEVEAVQIATTQNTSRKNHSLMASAELHMRGGMSDYALFDVFPQQEPLRADVVVLSACEDNQVAADAFINGNGQGAMTFAFCKVLQDWGPSVSLGSLQNAMRTLLKDHGYTQIPQLSIGSKLSGNSSLQAWGL